MQIMQDENNTLKYSLAYTGCFKTFNIASCVRDSCLTLLAVVTFFVCVIKLCKLHSHRHSLPNQYIVFYSGIVECLLWCITPFMINGFFLCRFYLTACGINWFYLAKTAVFLVTQFIKVCQILIVTKFHCCLAARMIGLDDKFRRYSNKVFGALLVACLVMTILGLATMKHEYEECAEPEWLLLSSTEIFIVQVFMASGVFITRELNTVRMLADDRAAQKRDLWGIIFIFELSALVSLIHDIVMRITGPENHCQGVFLKTKAGYTAVYIAVNIIRWLLPLWAMAAIFDTENNQFSQDDYMAPGFAVNDDSGNFTSQFRPRTDSFHYKHLHDDIGAVGRPLLPPFSSHPKSLTSMGSSYGSTAQGTRSSSDRYPPIA